MTTSKSRWEELVELLETDEAIPTVSAIFILLLFFLFSDLGYRLVETVTMLLFYAVLVRIWTEMMPNRSELLHGPGSHLVFLFVSAGAVAMGIMLEHWVASLSGTVLPAQFLALAVLISRVYIRSIGTNKPRAAVLLEDLHDRYVILIPCLFVILFPVMVHQFEISNLIIVQADILVSQTTESFLYLTSLGIGVGAVAYVYFEDQIGHNTE